VNLFNNDFDNTPTTGFNISDNTVLNSGNNLDNVDPLFVNAPIGDYHLDAASPVIDMGDNAAPARPANDLDGNCRPADLFVEMGAYENGTRSVPNDFNGDCTSDMLLRHTKSGIWYTYLMNADGVTILQGGYPPFAKDTNWQMAGIGDFNGDGVSDVLLRHTNGTWYTYLMNADGLTALQGGYPPFTKDTNWQMAGIGDFNGDGTSDVLVRHTNGTWYTYLMNADGLTALQGGFSPFTKDTNYTKAGIGDFNGDGTSDVLVRHTNGTWYTYLMNTDGFTALQGGYPPFTKNTNWEIAGIGDFNGDVISDVLIRNQFDGRWGVYLMNVDGISVLQESPLPLTLNRNWQLEGIGNFNVDGTSDVLIRNQLDGRWGVYLMNGDGVSVLQGANIPFTKDLNWQQLIH